ncbi:MAG: sulfite exporter TauE/SafE family protein [Spirosomataceae bacterium]
MLYSAFIMGLVGSLHCVGMCGPISLMMPTDRSKRFNFVLGRILYNSGRILTYSLLGLVIGLLGEQVSLFASQKVLSITFGILIITFLLIPQKLQNQISLIPIVYKFNSFIKSKLSRFFKKYSLFSQFSFGLLNGLLPCGLVYAAMSGAFLMSHLWEGALFMFLFGLGTVPMMLSFGLGSHWVKNLLGNKLQKLIPITLILSAFLLLYRGFFVELPKPDSEEITNCHPKF